MKFHEFTLTDGSTIRLNQEQISEILAQPNDITVIRMSNGNTFEVNLVMHKVFEKLGVDL
jgi:uncharacterized protein YlzI (FlbEa/FlbD family)